MEVGSIAWKDSGGIDRVPVFARVRRQTQRWLHRDDPSGLSRLAASGVAWAAARRARIARPPRPAVPTVVVGSLSVGGAGKSPIVRWLAERLSTRARVAVLGHGHGGLHRGPARIAEADGRAFGDEAAAMVRAMPEVMVIAGGRRAERHRLACDAGAEVIVVDDGFQDPAVPRTVDVVVVDATAGHVPWPAGPLRESIGALARADLVWSNKIDEPGARPLPPPFEPHVTSRYAAVGVRLPDGRTAGPEWLAGRALRPICGIGRPGSFHHRLTAAGATLADGVERADHHRFGRGELADLPRDLPWITTTKDRERLPAGWPVAVLDIGLVIETGGARLDALCDRLVGGGA